MSLLIKTAVADFRLWLQTKCHMSYSMIFFFFLKLKRLLCYCWIAIHPVKSYWRRKKALELTSLLTISLESLLAFVESVCGYTAYQRAVLAPLPPACSITQDGGVGPRGHSTNTITYNTCRIIKCWHEYYNYNWCSCSCLTADQHSIMMKKSVRDETFQMTNSTKRQQKQSF